MKDGDIVSFIRWMAALSGKNYVIDPRVKGKINVEVNSAVNRYDLSLTTGGGQYNPPRSRIPSNFAPYASKPLEITFTLSRASEVTSFMGRFNVSAYLRTSSKPIICLPR